MKLTQYLSQRNLPVRILFLAGAMMLLGCAQNISAQPWLASPSPSPNNNIYYNAGNVGIGTNAPDQKLVVSANSATVSGLSSVISIYGADGGAATVGMAAFGSNTGLVMRRANTSTASPSALVAEDPIGVLSGAGYGTSAYTSSRVAMRFRASENWTDSAQGTYIMFATTANGAATVGGTERMRIDNAGNVGIGTASPVQKLHLFSGGVTDNVIQHFQNGTRNWSMGINGAADFFRITDNTVGVARLTILNTGNVGIGTTSPGYLLDVAGTIRSSIGGFRFPDNTVQATAATMTGVTAGAGLTGGGTSGAATVDIGQGTGVTVAADSISVNYGSTAGTAVQGNTSVTVTAGTGMTGGGSLTLGAGGSVTLTNNDAGSAQNIFKNIGNAAGATQFSAASNSDSVRFEGTGGASVTFDGSAKKVTIDASNITSSQWTTSGSNINYAPPGNVGIGNTAPGYKLDVNGTVNATGVNINGSPITSSQWTTSGSNINYAPTGNVGIGTSTPTSKLHVTGDGKFTGNLTVDGNIAAKYQDVAEWVPTSEQITAGTVVVLDTTKSNQVVRSTQSYDTRVAGVISAQPGITLGEGGEGKVLVATTGRVLVKVDATNNPIHIGDLLVTSDVPGVAMKSEPIKVGGRLMHMPGTLIGKALEPMAKGSGKILVLLSLQ